MKDEQLQKRGSNSTVLCLCSKLPYHRESCKKEKSGHEEDKFDLISLISEKETRDQEPDGIETKEMMLNVIMYVTV